MGLGTFLSNLPLPMSEGIQTSLKKSWIQQYYVKYVAESVERCARASWVFLPEISVEGLPECKRAAARSAYASVDADAETEIAVTVDNENSAVIALVPSSTDATAKAEIRMGVACGELCDGCVPSFEREDWHVNYQAKLDI